VDTDRPGKEFAQYSLYRDVVDYLIDSQGWSYKLPKRGGCPLLLPADRSQGVIRVPKTGHTGGYRFANWVAAIRRAGGQWPPGLS
jgi:hypothetical protein